jgi:hypothetical protein
LEDVDISKWLGLFLPLIFIGGKSLDFASDII